MPTKNIPKFKIWDQALQRLDLPLFSEDFFLSHLLVLLLQGLGFSCAALCWPEFRTFSPCWPSRPPPPLYFSSPVPFLLRLGTCPVHWTDLFFWPPEHERAFELYGVNNLNKLQMLMIWVTTLKLDAVLSLAITTSFSTSSRFWIGTWGSKMIPRHILICREGRIRNNVNLGQNRIIVADVLFLNSAIGKCPVHCQPLSWFLDRLIVLRYRPET